MTTFSTGGSAVTFTTSGSAVSFAVTAASNAFTTSAVTTPGAHASTHGAGGADPITTLGTVAFNAGAAATPTVAFSGDPNTGLYSPGADQVAVTTAGTARLYVGATGNVGIGTTGPAFTLDVRGAIGAGDTISTGQGVSTGNVFIEVGGQRTADGAAIVDWHGTSATDYEARIARIGGANGNFNIDNTGTGNIQVRALNAGQVLVSTAGTTAITVDTSQVASFGSAVSIPTGNPGSPTLRFTGDTNTGIYSPGADQVGIATAGTARVIVDASGNFGVGMAASGNGRLVVNGGKIVHISPDLNSSLSLDIDNSAATNITSYDAGGSSMSLNTTTTGGVVTERMRIDNAGLITGTGTSLGAWTNYTPTVTSGTGTLTTVTANGYYCQIGKIVHLRARITLTTNGTGATDLRMTMPVAARNVDVRPIGTGRESSVTGKQLVVWALQNGSTAYLVFYDNTYPGGDGRTFDLSMTYEIN